MATRVRDAGTFCAAVIAVLCLADHAAADTVTVFAAASTTNILTDVATAFEQQTGTAPRLSFAGSSTLARQIINGAPADIYLSANIAWMDRLEADGLLVAGSRYDLLGNSLALVAPEDGGFDITIAAGMPLAAALGDSRLAIADPSHVPAGIYAREALQTLGVWSEISRKLAFAASVRDALAFVARGEVAAGIAYVTDARISPRVRVVAQIPATAHTPIRYPVARIARAGHPAAERLYAFLRSADAIAVYRRYGFVPLVAAETD